MKKLIKNPLFILAVAVLLLLGSSVGSTRAAMNYHTNAISLSFSTAEVGVALLENDEVVEDTTKTTSDDGTTTSTTTRTLLTRFTKIENPEQFEIGKNYDEVLTISNTSKEYPAYVRIIITKGWVDAAGNKDTFLNPELIELPVATTVTIMDADGAVGSAKLIAKTSDNKEQTIYYLDTPLGVGQYVDVTNTLTVNDSVTTDATNSDINNVITTTYNYQNHSFILDAEVDAVQTHNAKDAIYGAWGVTADISDSGIITDIN